MRARKKQLIYYSMALNHQCYASVVGQFMRSVESLRRHNPRVPIKLVVTGGALNAEDRARVAALSVVVATTRGYEEEIKAYLPAKWARAMCLFPLIHKWLNLRYVIQEDFDRVLYVDNDTYFTRDVGELISRSSSADVVAREEPRSRKSWLAYDPAYIDEDALTVQARSEKLRSVTPFNAGVVLLRRPAAEWLAANLDLFMGYLMRFTVWMCNHPAADDLPYVVAAVNSGLHKRALNLKPLPFPGRNRWLVEERALWLTLGNTSFTVKCFSWWRVMQGGEFVLVQSRRDRPYLIHYYSANAEPFSKWLDRFGRRLAL